MSKLQEVKEAIKNTPPERLAKIEYQSHFLQIIGVTAVSLVLIFKGFWYIIFAFIFSVGISVSQGIGAYQKYNLIMSIIGKEKYNPKTDKSFTRSRDYINTSIFGLKSKFFSLVLSLALVFLVIPYHTWYFKIFFAICLLAVHSIIYFRIIYSFANKIWEVKNNEEKNK